ncbi:MAG: acetyl-CoA carboxylase biotin carboxyl carrier protein [Gammaproteobacteria bacterium]
MPGQASFIDPSVLHELASVLIETGLTEIEIERNGLRLRLQRAGQGAGNSAIHQVAVTTHNGSPQHSAPSPTPAEHAIELAAQPGTVKSPMVGTAYLAPAPGAANFIDIDSQVKEGQTILIIEAMKTMNQIHAPRSGRITHIFVQNAQPVEFGEPLVVIE